MDLQELSSSPRAEEELDSKEKDNVAIPTTPDDYVDELPTAKARRWALISLLASGLALTADGYQNSLLTTGNVIFKKLYPKEYSSSVQTRVSNALLVGTILGQICVGLMTDRISRKSSILMTTAFVVVGGIIGCAAGGPDIFWIITVGRGIIGFGAGGEYPAVSAQAIEAGEKSTVERGTAFIYTTKAAVYGGQILSIIVFVVGLAASRYDSSSTPSELHKLDIIWRVEWAIGCCLPLTVLYFRLRLTNSRLFSKYAQKKRVPYWLFLKLYWKPLIGSFVTWFAQQFANYPLNTFSGTVITSVLGSKATTLRTACWTLLVTSFIVPSVPLSALACRYFSRVKVITAGFVLYMVLTFILGGLWEKITKIVPLFVILYGVTLTAVDFGPTNLNALVLVETYPSAMRGTAYGFISCIGKIGGICSTYAFQVVVSKYGFRYSFMVCGAVSFVGALFSFFFLVDKKGVSLEEEDIRWTQYLAENGWEGDIGETDRESIESY